MATRSPPLIINKESGEPTFPNLPPREGVEIWRVILMDGSDSKKGRKFSTYSDARKFAVEMRDKYTKGNGYEVTLVSLAVGYGPPFKRLSDDDLRDLNSHGIFWCAYCRKPRRFTWFSNKWQDCCPVCEIPLFDFHITKNNPHFWKE